MTTGTYTFEGKPYFVYETDQGLFKVLNSLIPNSDKTVTKEYKENLGTLTLGMDIREISSRGLTILVKTPKNDTSIWISSVVEKCRKFAAVSGCDYVTTERFGPYLAQLLFASSCEEYYEAAPRLFRKIVND